MAVFCSPCKSSFLSLQPSKRFPIEGIFIAKAINSSIPISKVSTFTSPFRFKISIQTPNCWISSSSSPDPNNVATSSTIIFVKGLPVSASEGRLEMAFLPFGDVCRVKIITDKNTKQSLGFAYIWFTSHEAARTAVKEMNGKFLDGRFISVMIAKPGSCAPRFRPTPYKF